MEKALKINLLGVESAHVPQSGEGCVLFVFFPEGST